MPTKVHTFETQEELAHYLLDRVLPYCSNFRERLQAAMYAANESEKLWRKYSNE